MSPFTKKLLHPQGLCRHKTPFARMTGHSKSMHLFFSYNPSSSGSSSTLRTHVDTDAVRHSHQWRGKSYVQLLSSLASQKHRPMSGCPYVAYFGIFWISHFLLFTPGNQVVFDHVFPKANRAQIIFGKYIDCASTYGPSSLCPFLEV